MTIRMTAAVQTADARVAVVNGPRDMLVDWPSINWRHVDDDVRRLRQRIFTASKAGDLAKVRNLQKLMLRSRANALLSVRRVTQINAGRKTAGIDGEVVVLPEEQAELADWMQNRAAPWTPKPVKRVYISKANGRRRPLGIPVIADRSLQALTLNALEPEWEARFEPRSYGFRSGRGCQDAIQAIFNSVSGKNAKRLWVLDADLAGAFDHLDHDHLLTSLGTFPGRGLIAQWLKAGVVEKGRLTPTGEGSPQGGVISPLMMNVALHGMETAAGVRYRTTGLNAGATIPGYPTLIRYADDLLALCHSREQAEQVQAKLAGWLVPRGLTFNDDKTSIRHLDVEGCDFLGFTIRRFNGKLLIKPSKAAMRRIRERLTAEVKALRGANAAAVIAKLNPIIKGWAAYYRGVVSSKAFARLDNHMWRLTYKWAKHSHSNKPRNWIVKRYFGQFNPSRQDHWVFGDRDSGAYLTRFAWTKIVRHVQVKGGASPDDPTLTDYWASRRRTNTPPLDRTGLRLLQMQQGRCPLCRELLLHADREPQDPQEWEKWFKVIGQAIRRQAIATDTRPASSDEPVALRLIHAHCLRRKLATGTGTALLTAREPSGFA
jgi:RNA-directed DNA polymerase